MDQVKTGEMIRRFRTQLGLTQRELAEKLNVSDKAVSKWERGSGCPDISLLPALADIFGTDIQVLLSGETDKNEREKGDMKKIRFYVCPQCGNIMTACSEAAVTCCGGKLTALEAKKAEHDEQLTVQDIGGELFISSEHEMTKQHYISFAALLTDSSVMMYRQYPEWNLQLTMPLYRFGRLVWYCTKHGLMYMDLKP